MTTLYYLHDPMCSWCWAFRPAWRELRRQLPASLRITPLLGGLAPDCDAPMLAETAVMIRAHWRRIEAEVPGTEFNFAFWESCAPRRSTWPGCRAVIATRLQQQDCEAAMILAIQQAYYLHARNPSDADVLIDLAVSLGLDRDRFRADLNAPATQRLLRDEIGRARRLGAQSGARGFPSLVLERQGTCSSVRIDYHDAAAMTARIGRLLAANA